MVSGDLHDPGRILGLVTQLAQTLEASNKHLLSQVFGIMGVAHHAQAGQEDRPVMVLDQLSIGCPVPTLGCLYPFSSSVLAQKRTP